jgi:hypothetical protein
MSESNDVLSQLLKGTVTDIMPHKDLVIEAVEDPEIKEALNEYLSAKIKEVNATLKLAKAGAKLGLNLIPDNLRAEVSRDIVALFEKELGVIMEKGL